MDTSQFERHESQIRENKIFSRHHTTGLLLAHQRPHTLPHSKNKKGIYIVANLHCNLDRGGGPVSATDLPSPKNPDALRNSKQKLTITIFF
jgi:hypothetical protein